MQDLSYRVFAWVLRLVLSLRYTVVVRGAEQLDRLENKPILVLPNHPAYIDPLILISQLGRTLSMRPLVFAGTYRISWLVPLMNLTRAVEVPDLSRRSRQAKREAEQMLSSVVAELKRKEIFLIYPSGRLQRGGIELIGGSSAVAEIVTQVQDLQIVLVRTSGLWGSMFSFAQTGTLPKLDECVWRGLLSLLSNGLFFAPRRCVSVDIEVTSASKFESSSRGEINRRLEQWYNQPNAGKPDEKVFVPYNRFFRAFLGNPSNQVLSAVSQTVTGFSENTKSILKVILAEKFNCNVDWEAVDLNSPLDQLGLDSLQRLEFASEIEASFNVECHAPPTSLAEALAVAEGRAVSEETCLTVAPKWFNSKQSDRTALPKGTYLLESFIFQAKDTPHNVAIADDDARTFTYQEMLLQTLLLSRHLSPNCDGQYLGILLPASGAASVALLSSHAAGKIPVFLNWTTGSRALALSMEALSIKTILTSQVFFDRLDFDFDDQKIIFLEDLRRKVSFRSLLAAKLGALRGAKSLIRSLPVPDRDDAAVILFTSGSENAPKAVPLSHQNLLSNITAVSRALDLKQSDSMIGFLPPFHSFGILGGILCPLLTGMKAVYHPDPTAHRAIAQKIAAYKANLLISTPTFLDGILRASHKDELASLRTVITGAESAPESLALNLKGKVPNVQLGQGYGITECSPVISISREFEPNLIGKPLDNLSVKIVSPENLEAVESGQVGLLLVKGPSVFNGYLNYSGPSPFYTDDDGCWYNTGDLASLDTNGNLRFSGRLKRFIKSAGEMVSLPLLESVFKQEYPNDEDGPQVAVEGIETDSGSHIVLFTRKNIEYFAVLEILKKAGLRGVMRIDEVKRIDLIPMLGSGKIDYRSLKQLIQKPDSLAKREHDDRAKFSL